MDRRTALTRIAAAAAGIAAAIAAIPFVRYLQPSERAKALGASVSVDLSLFQPGDIRSIVWRGQTVLIMRRTDAQVNSLRLTNNRVLDDSDSLDNQPDYIDPIHRSSDSEFLVVIGNCTHLGCIPNEDFDTGRSLLGDWWPGGFHCPCHDSMYDYAGRVVRGPAPTNLRVPPHKFVSETLLIVGDEPASA